jgi:pimeloyl-ACP methyl ester carboxylesterase
VDSSSSRKVPDGSGSLAPSSHPGSGSPQGAAGARRITPPPPWSLLRETLTIFDVLGLVSSGVRRTPAKGLEGTCVVTFPGFGFGDEPMLPLRLQLRRHGANATGWCLGRNHGHVVPLLLRARGRIEALAAEAGRPVTIVGWSLGGYLAREVARDLPHCVARVITLATPVIGGPRYTVLSGWFERLGYDLEQIALQVDLRRSRPLEVPVTAIYSSRDGVVAWRACIDPACEATEYVAVKATHVGICYAPRVLEIISDRLALDAAAGRAGADVDGGVVS